MHKTMNIVAVALRNGGGRHCVSFEYACFDSYCHWNPSRLIEVQPHTGTGIVILLPLAMVDLIEAILDDLHQCNLWIVSYRDQ